MMLNCGMLEKTLRNLSAARLSSQNFERNAEPIFTVGPMLEAEIPYLYC